MLYYQFEKIIAEGKTSGFRPDPDIKSLCTLSLSQKKKEKYALNKALTMNIIS